MALDQSRPCDWAQETARSFPRRVIDRPKTLDGVTHEMEKPRTWSDIRSERLGFSFREECKNNSVYWATSEDALLFYFPLLTLRMFYVLLNTFESYQQMQAPTGPRPVFLIYLKVKCIIENQKWGAINTRFPLRFLFSALKKRKKEAFFVWSKKTISVL